MLKYCKHTNTSVEMGSREKLPSPQVGVDCSTHGEENPTSQQDGAPIEMAISEPTLHQNLPLLHGLQDKMSIPPQKKKQINMVKAIVNKWFKVTAIIIHVPGEMGPLQMGTLEVKKQKSPTFKLCTKCISSLQFSHVARNTYTSVDLLWLQSNSFS